MSKLHMQDTQVTCSRVLPTVACCISDQLDWQTFILWSRWSDLTTFKISCNTMNSTAVFISEKKLTSLLPPPNTRTHTNTHTHTFTHPHTNTHIHTNRLTALHYAVQSNSHFSLQVFARLPEITHLPDNDGRTPLMVAALNSFDQALKVSKLYLQVLMFTWTTDLPWVTISSTVWNTREG